MSSPVVSENLFLVYSLMMGIFITFVYDIFRIGRRVCAHNLFFISLEDVIFWVFCAVSVFYMMHTQSNGTLRWFAIFGALTGMLLYRKTLSPFLVKWVSKGLKALIGLLKRILKFLAKPFGFLAKTGTKAGRKVSYGSRRAAGFMKKRLTVLGKMLKIILCKR